MNNIPKLKQISYILGLSILAGVVRNVVQDEPLPWIKEPRILSTISNFIIPELMREPLAINLEFTKHLHDKNEAVFIDARDVDEYETGHIANALNIPFDEAEYYVDQILSLEPEYPVVIYCSGGECDLSINLGDLLFEEYEFFYVLIYEGGYPEWESSGYAVE